MCKKKENDIILELYRSAKFGHYIQGFIHNINNPLTTISGRFQLLQFSNPEIPYLEELNQLLLKVNEMISMLGDIASFDFHNNSSYCEITSVINYLDFFMLADSTYKHYVAKDLQTSPTVFLNITYSDMFLLLLHIFQNAVDSLKLSDKESKKLVFKYEVEKPYVFRFSVEDNGVGIKKEIKDKIFEPGFSTKESNWELYRFPRYGYGLKIVKTIVEKYNGELKIHSAEKEGTIVFVSLPVVKSF